MSTYNNIQNLEKFICMFDKVKKHQDDTNSSPRYVWWGLIIEQDVLEEMFSWASELGHVIEVKQCRRGNWDVIVEWERE